MTWVSAPSSAKPGEAHAGPVIDHLAEEERAAPERAPLKRPREMQTLGNANAARAISRLHSNFRRRGPESVSFQFRPSGTPRSVLSSV